MSARSPARPLANESFALLREVRDYAIYMIDPDGVIQTWNDGARAIKGYEADEVIGTSFTHFFTEEDRATGRPARLLERAAVDGRVEDEAWRVRKGGARFWANVVMTAVHDEDGSLRGYVKVTRDLSERRRAEELLRQSEERLRLLVESVRDYAIFMLTPEGKIATWNTGAERIKGYAASEIIGRHFSVFYPPETVASGHPERELVIATREGRYEEEGWRVRQDGQRFWAHVVITAVHDPLTAELRGFAKVTRDLTDRRRMEEAARAAIEQAALDRARAEGAETAVRIRDEFLSVAAHELRTPLAALALKLDGLAGLVRRIDGPAGPSLTARVVERMDAAVDHAGRLASLIDRLLDVSRIARDRLALVREPTDLGEVTTRVAEDLREAAARAGSEIRVRTTAVVGAWDAARLEQVVVNLLSNAIKYGAGAPIDVEVEATATGARLAVHDRGIGIEGEHLELIFGRFERVAPAHHFGGLGLGLYITRSLVEAHGGTVRASSLPGEGSTFIVELPRDKGDAASPDVAWEPRS